MRRTAKKRKRNKKNCFFPSKTAVWQRAPAWVYKKKNTELSEQQQAKLETDKERMEKIIEDKKMNLVVDVRKTFYNMKRFKKLDFTYNKPTNYNDPDPDKFTQYKKWKEENPPIYPGPQQYWKTLPYSKTKKKKKDEDEDKQEEDDGPKKYLLNREVTDKRVYKPMKKHVF